MVDGYAMHGNDEVMSIFTQGISDNAGLLVRAIGVMLVMVVVVVML